MPKKNSTLFVRSVWTMLTVFFTLLLVFFMVGSSIANDNSAAINGLLNINPYEKETIEGGEEIDSEYFKSDFVKKNADGSIQYVTDEDGYKHQVYDDEAMRAHSKRVAEQVAVEGSVLLWNDGDALPLAKGDGVSVFGVGAVNYTYLGLGSGAMNANPVEGSLVTALRGAGLSVNMKLFTEYSSLASKYKGRVNGIDNWKTSKFEVNEAPWSEVSAVANQTVGNYGDAAVMVITRNAGEDQDIQSASVNTYPDEYVGGEKNYLELTVEEAGVLKGLNELKKAGKLENIVLVLNTANPMQFQNIRSAEYGVDACLWVGMGGNLSFVQIADVLTNTGDFVLSGRTPDTLAVNNYSAPSYANFGDFTWSKLSSGVDTSHEYEQRYATHNTKYIAYQEGVYVGYRYYETRYEDYVLGNGNAADSAGATDGKGWAYSEEVAFPFGYGESYADFEYGDKIEVKESEDKKSYEISLTITNSKDSKYAGKDVLQVYLQKPYTEYDEKNGIEKPAVELVGFAKTEKLQPGDSQTLTVTVDKEDFRTYDAYGKGTYILEKGDYYLAVGTDAHDALNNVLAAKKLTQEQKARMDGAGNGNFAYKITVENDDYETYSVSAETGKPIANRLSDADINLYEGTKGQEITYLSRKDWKATWPKGVTLECTSDAMVRDMQYGHEVKAAEGDEMPVYGKVTAEEGQLSLAMLMELPFDSPKWDNLLDQMTLEEQQWMCSYGLKFFAGASSVDAPGGLSIDGPGGVKVNNPTIGTQMCFPSPVVMAATWNAPLIEDLGEAFGLEALHAGISLVYAPGANIHRSPYGGRNWEYYSEDGVLSGEMLCAEITGLQSRGIIVMTKHFAINDQETNRYGVATFFNEQSAREIYLKPFEIAIREGNMNGVMTSFNRIGCTWSGAHKGLLTDILRDEWNFIGIAETDAMSGGTYHMGDKYAKAEGLVAGQDMWMAGGAKDYFADSTDNPTVMLALREACHRILYTQLHSAAMNSVSENTRIVMVMAWWQKALVAFQVVFGVLAAACLVMAVLSFVFNTEKYKEWKRLAPERAAAKAAAANAAASVTAGGGSSGGSSGGSGNGNKPVKRSFFIRHKKLIISVTSIVLAAAIVLSIALPIALRKGDEGDKPTPPPTPQEHVCEQKCPVCGGCLDFACEEEVCKTKCGAGKESHVFEAEDAVLASGSGGALRVESSGDVKFVGNLNQNIGAMITFNVLAEKVGTASLVVSVNERVAQTEFTENIVVTVNDKELESPAVVPSNGSDKETWTTFTDINLGCIALKEGANTISFQVLGNAYNFDKISLLADTGITENHVCSQKCPVCGGCLDLTCEEEVCKDKCGAEYKNKTKLEAEDAQLGAGEKGDPKIDYKPENGPAKTVGNLSENKGATITFTFESEQAGRANLVAAATLRQSEKVLTDAFNIKINGGEALERPSVVPASELIGSDGNVANDWWNSKEVNLGCIDLVEGTNTIVFEVASSSNSATMNLDYIVVNSAWENGEKSLTDLEVKYTGKTDYDSNEEFEKDKLTVTAKYSNGDSEDVTAEAVVSALPTASGEGTVTVSYGGITKEITVNITHVCSEKCPVCGGCLNPDCEETSCAKKCASEGTDYTFEAENAVIKDGENPRRPANVQNANGGKVVGDLNNNQGSTVTFAIDSSAAAQATVSVTINRRNRETVYGDLIKIAVNGRELVSPKVIPAFADQWKDEAYMTFNLGHIQLDKGVNTIVFTHLTAGDWSGYNFDNIVIKTTAVLTEVKAES